MTEPQGADLFGAAYGRLMMLAGQALANGHAPLNVGRAINGNGIYLGPLLNAVLRQRSRVNAEIEEALLAGVTAQDMVNIARVAREQAQGEWHVHIPLRLKGGTRGD